MITSPGISGRSRSTRRAGRSGRAILAVVAVAALMGSACSDDPATTGADDSRTGSGASADGEPTVPLVAAFSFEPDYEVTGPTSCPLRDITFTDESRGGPETWHWEFSDGSTSDEKDPVVTEFISEATLTVTRGESSDSVTEFIGLVMC